MLKLLPIADLHIRHAGISAARAASYFEAAGVCLGRHHVSPAELMIHDASTKQTVEANWPVVTATAIAAWASEREATEHGATCCVVAGVEITRGLLAVHRADIGLGADYYVGPPGAGTEDLEDCIRLEISGLDKGDDTTLKYRVAVKVKQAKKGNSSLPAIAGVIGFEAKLLLIQDVPL